MRKTRLILIGGFLGAGKTTLMARAASRMVARGLKVGLITNDQAAGLVDTQIARGVTDSVREVAGGCFCCKFGDLVAALKDVFREFTPDVVLAEPVGSCTDLAATVLRPLRAYYSEMLDIAPYSALVDPARLREALAETSTLLSDNVRYILLKQIEEADLIVLNKCDLLTQAEIAELTRLADARFPGRRLLAISALRDADADVWLDAVFGSIDAPGRIVDVDYDAYADGEAELGWLNATVELCGRPDEDWAAFVRDFLARVRDKLAAEPAEIAHLKAFLESGSGGLRGNVTSLKGEPQLAGSCAPSAGPLRFLVNARVAASPDAVKAIVEQALTAARPTVRARVVSLEHFRPGRPEPVHRFKAE